MATKYSLNNFATEENLLTISLLGELTTERIERQTFSDVCNRFGT